jgi:hypothetical protein
MQKALLKRLVVTFMIATLGLVAMPQETQARALYIHDGAFLHNGNLMKGHLYASYDYGSGLYWIEYSGRDMWGNPVHWTGWGYVYDKQGTTSVSDQYTFDVQTSEQLQVRATVDAQCDVYEIASGKAIVKDTVITSNSGYQVIPMQYTSQPYLITFKVNGDLVSKQIFYFSNNSNITGGL